MALSWHQRVISYPDIWFQTQTYSAHLVAIRKGSNAERAGLQVGDELGDDCPFLLRFDFDNFDSALCAHPTTLIFKDLQRPQFGMRVASSNGRTANIMLRISVVDSRTQCRLVLEGRLIAPWVAELRTAWKRAKAELDGRELVIDMGSVIVVSQEAENALLQMMNEGARFRRSGVLTRHLLQQLRQRSRKNVAQADMATECPA